MRVICIKSSIELRLTEEETSSERQRGRGPGACPAGAKALVLEDEWRAMEGGREGLGKGTQDAGSLQGHKGSGQERSV